MTGVEAMASPLCELAWPRRCWRDDERRLTATDRRQIMAAHRATLPGADYAWQDAAGFGRT